ncbi:MAG: cytochrome c [Methylococcaceae bacterium]|nr:cytochrome c [Methylococcaceae bacterium]
MLLCGSVSADEPAPAKQQELRNLLKHDCGACHGLQLKGGLGPPLLPEALADKSDVLLLDTIQNGRPGTAMPPWKSFLTVDETNWLIRLLRQP